MPALGLSDLSNTFGCVKFYRAARGAGIKPVFGCDVWVANAVDRNRPSRLMLLVQHRDGYRRLCELLTRAYQENLYRGRAEINPAWLADGTEGLLALSGGDAGDVAQAILDEKPDAACTAAEAWAALFPGRCCLGLQRAGRGPARPSSTSRRRMRWRNCSPTCRKPWPTASKSPSAAI